MTMQSKGVRPNGVPVPQSGRAGEAMVFRLKDFLMRILKEQTLIVVFVFIIIAMGASTPVFLTTRNLLNILLQTSMTAISAAGMTMIILMADIDLSVGSIAALAGVIGAKLQVVYGWHTLPAVVLPLAVSFVLGLASGLVVAKLSVHSFVVTLGMLSIARGFCLILTDGQPVSGLSASFNYLGQGIIGFVPLPAIVMLGVILIIGFVLSQTKFGRGIYAIGGNKEAARLSGIPVDRIRILVFGLCATLSGMAGIILAGRVTSGQPVAWQGAELDVIASVIIGGTSLYGGRGGVGKTLIGALILGILRNGFNLIGVTPYWQRVFIGFLIVLTVVLDRLQHRNEE
jgi:ribose transport system permease protein